MKLVEKEDDQGGVEDETLVPIMDIWASVKTMNGQRLMTYQQIVMGQWYTVRFAWFTNPPLAYGDPIRYEGRDLIVHEMYDKDERREEWVLICYEKRSRA